MTDLYDELKRCNERLGRLAGKRIGEQNTKASLIEPVIGALGWELLDPDEVHREFRRRPSDNPVDYALLHLRDTRLFIEAKGLGENLDDPKWASQMISYAATAGVSWVVLTDGREWRIYNAHAPVPIEDKLLRTVRVDRDVDEAADVLALLSKENMRDQRLDEMWKIQFVDRQVRDALTQLFSGAEPSRELVAFVHKRVPQLAKADVRASLVRARATFDFPDASFPGGTDSSPRLPTPTSTASAATNVTRPYVAPASGGKAAEKVTAAERGTTLADVVAAGAIPGNTIRASYGGTVHTATVDSGGNVTYQHIVYRSLSAAGEAMKVALRGPNIPPSVKATDGWSFWSATDAAGNSVKLRELRRRTATGQ